MKQHQYRVTVEHLSNARGEPVSAPPLVFTARNHDDLFAIVERSRSRALLGSDDSAALAIGFKLLFEIALEHRDEAPFSELRGPLRTFLQTLKAVPVPGPEVPTRA